MQSKTLQRYDGLGEDCEYVATSLKKEERMNKLSFPTKLAYWVGQVAESLKNTTLGLFLLFYYNQVLGLSGTLCGLAIVLDAVSDPVMGSLSDGWKSKRWGRRHGFMYAAAIPMALCFFFLFNPLVSSTIGLFIWLVVFSILTRIFMTLYSVPHMAMGAEITDDYHERTNIVAGRGIFGIIGTLLTYGIGFGIFFKSSEAFENGQLDPSAYAPYAATLAVLMVITIWLSAWGTRHLIPSMKQPKEALKLSIRSVFSDVMVAFQNHSFRWLVLGFVIISTPVGVAAALHLYKGTFFWQVSSAQMPFLLAATPLGSVFGLILAPLIGRRIQKKELVMWSPMLWLFFTATPVCLFYAGLWPTLGSTTSLFSLFLFAFVGGIALAQLGVSVGSMLADIADEHDLNTGQRQEGVFFGASAFCSKATGGIGNAVGGVALDLINWPTATAKVAADVPAETLFKLAMFAGPGLLLFFIPAVWCFKHYSLTRERHASIQQELAARNSVPASEV